MTDFAPHETRLDQADAEALRWYYAEGSNFGLRSATGGQLDKLKYGLPPTAGRFVDPYTDRLLEDIDKSRGIRDLLARLPGRSELVLRRYYGPRNWFQMVAYGDFAGVAPLTEAARFFSGAANPEDAGRMVSVCRALSIRCAGGAGAGATATDKRTVRAINAEAGHMVALASADWLRLRGAYDAQFRPRAPDMVR
jgi:hypothetical protein